MDVIGETKVKRERGKIKLADLEKMDPAEVAKMNKKSNQDDEDVDIAAILANKARQPKWVETFRTEVIPNYADPIYMDTLDLAATRYDLINIKVEFWH